MITILKKNNIVLDNNLRLVMPQKNLDPLMVGPVGQQNGPKIFKVLPHQTLNSTANSKDPGGHQNHVYPNNTVNVEKPSNDVIKARLALKTSLEQKSNELSNQRIQVEPSNQLEITDQPGNPQPSIKIKVNSKL